MVSVLFDCIMNIVFILVFVFTHFCFLFLFLLVNSRPVHQINWQKSRYIYDLYYTYERITKEVYDYCITNKIVDSALIAKWKKSGYERLCSTYVINPKNFKFGTVSVCRVPKQFLAPGTQIEDPTTGCRGCASGSGGERNIFGNKYGQYLAAIQIARENRVNKRHRKEEKVESEEEDEEEEEAEAEETREKKSFGSAQGEALKVAPALGGGGGDKGDGDESDRTGDGSGSDSDDDDEGPVGAADGSSGKKSSIWAAEAEQEVELTETMIGTLDPDMVAKYANKGKAGGGGSVGKASKDLGEIPGKRSRLA